MSTEYARMQVRLSNIVDTVGQRLPEMSLTGAAEFPALLFAYEQAKATTQALRYATFAQRGEYQRYGEEKLLALATAYDAYKDRTTTTGD